MLILSGENEPYIPSGSGIRQSPDRIILVFENFTLADEPFAKALQILKTCVSVNDNLCGKLVLPLESLVTFDKRLKNTAVPFFIPNFIFFQLCIRQFYI